MKRTSKYDYKSMCYNFIRDEERDNEAAVKEMYRLAKEKELEEQEEKKTKELQRMLETFKKPEAKSTSIFASGDNNEVKKNGLGPKITIKAKKVKTEEQSAGKGQVNLLEEPKKPEPKPKSAALNLCSYSDDDE